MKLSINQIKEITTGAVVIKEENGWISLNRFTQEQEELYKKTSEDFYNKTFSTAGIKFSFKTDSKNLFIKLKTSAATSRKYFSVDVFVNGNIIGYIDNYSDIELYEDYTKQEYSLGEFSKFFRLGEGVKNVCVHLPWSVKTLIGEVSLDDNSLIEGIKPNKKLLAFGDSITNGYDALRSSNRYISKLSDILEAEEYNKAIGGEQFFPELAKLKDDFIPDYITVAYGTNDWNRIDEETFNQKCRDFYLNLSKNYPQTRIFAITPIWRKDMNEDRVFGEFKKVEENIRKTVQDIENITVISGFDFVPQDENFYADSYLHPNDAGFCHYAKNIYKKISLELKCGVENDEIFT